MPQPLNDMITSTIVGVQGPAGPTGATGGVGPVGATGDTGPQGLTGAIGPAGPAFTTTLPNVGLTITQQPADLQTFQRRVSSGGLFSKGYGNIPVTVGLSGMAFSIEYRLRDAVATGNPVLQDWLLAGIGVAGGETLKASCRRHQPADGAGRTDPVGAGG